MVQEINDNIVKGIIAENSVTCIKFWAEWCEPCKQIAPKYEALSEQVDLDVMMCSMAVDENPDTCEELNIRSIPTIVVFKDGTEERRFTGSDCVSQLKDYLN